MKIAHCPYCHSIQSSISRLGLRTMSPRLWRRAHSRHNVPVNHRRALIRNGRKG